MGDLDDSKELEDNTWDEGERPWGVDGLRIV